jgi:hypothetical protein
MVLSDFWIGYDVFSDGVFIYGQVKSSLFYSEESIDFLLFTFAAILEFDEVVCTLPVLPDLNHLWWVRSR